MPHTAPERDPATALAASIGKRLDSLATIVANYEGVVRGIRADVAALRALAAIKRP